MVSVVLKTLQVVLTYADRTGPQGMTRLFTRTDKLSTREPNIEVVVAPWRHLKYDATSVHVYILQTEVL